MTEGSAPAPVPDASGNHVATGTLWPDPGIATRASSNTTRFLAVPLDANGVGDAGDGGGEAPAEAPSAAAPVARLPLSANAERRGIVPAIAPRAADDARAGRARRAEGQARPARRTGATGAPRACVDIADNAGRVQVWAGGGGGQRRVSMPAGDVPTADSTSDEKNAHVVSSFSVCT